MRWILPAVLLGFILDLCIGDPRWLYHPICLIGNAISFLEKKLRKVFPETVKGERMAGILLVIFIVLFSTIIPWAILLLCNKVSPWLAFVLQTFWCYQILATKSLKTESMKVYDELEKGDLEGARYAVSMIVGRDTKSLSKEGVVKATVETIAENTSDGVIAPLFYMMIGGAVLGFTYKSINTMDSMVGYKNDKYKYFGTVAAKLDDVANFIPARISGILMILASYFCKMDAKNAKKIFVRDRYNHASPNSAQTESVMAGALDVQLAGDACYFGKLYKKKTIGDAIRPIEALDIKRASKLLYASAVIAAVVFGIVLFIVNMII